MEGMTSFKILRVDVQFVTEWPCGNVGLSLVGYDSPMSVSFESAHFSPFLPLPRRGSILVTCFACIFFRFLRVVVRALIIQSHHNQSLERLTKLQAMNV